MTESPPVVLGDDVVEVEKNDIKDQESQIKPNLLTSSTVSGQNGNQSQTAQKAKTIGQTDTWSKLQNLKELHDQGFITVTEYKERKSQIIDTLTGTKSKTSTFSRPPGASNIRQEFVPPRPPNFEGVVPEKALKHSFNPKTGEWTQRSILVKIEKTPFARGGLRKAFHLQFVNVSDSVDEDESKQTMQSSPTNRFVAKMSVDPEEDREAYIADVEMQAYAGEWTKKFNRFKPPKQVDFIKAAVLELVDRTSCPLIGVERFIDGPYHKHNNNYGFVSDDDRNTPQAFSHFTYEASMHMLLICDIQGVGDLYTDPQVHTIDGIGFGKGNLGTKGFQQFLASHRCNAICKYLGLPSINAKPDDSGTVPVARAAYTTARFTLDNMDIIEFHSKYYANRHLSPRTPLLSKNPPLKSVQEQQQQPCCLII